LLDLRLIPCHARQCFVSLPDTFPMRAFFT
jgi:hypothetical protein